MILEIKLNSRMCDACHIADGSKRNVEIYHLKIRSTSTSHLPFLTQANQIDTSSPEMIYFLSPLLILPVTTGQVYCILETGHTAESHKLTRWLRNTSIFRGKQTWLYLLSSP